MSSGFRLSRRSLRKLKGVHKDLVLVVEKALDISEVDFGVSCGLRTREEQSVLLQAGASQTMNSRHLTGHAVDLFAWVGGVRWDWPLYYKIAYAMNQAAMDHDVAMNWGGHWERFPDGPHFELDRGEYPS